MSSPSDVNNSQGFASPPTPSINETTSLSIILMASYTGSNTSSNAVSLPRPVAVYHDRPFLPSFAFCGPFGGNGAISASKWLKRFEYEHLRHLHSEHIPIPPKLYLSTVEMLLEGDAATWLGTTPKVLAICSKQHPTEADVSIFKDLFFQAFPATKFESFHVPDTFTKAFVPQSPTEKMREYFNRIATVFKNASVRSRLAHINSIDVDETTPGVNALEGAFLISAREQFIEGIYDVDVRKEFFATIDTTGMSLNETFKQAARIHSRIDAARQADPKGLTGARMFSGAMSFFFRMNVD